LPWLLAKQSQSSLAGQKGGSIGKALFDSTPGLLTKEGRAERAMALDYATKFGHTDPIFMESMDPGAFSDPIAKAIERNTRKSSFMVGYNYFKQIADNPTAALRMAGAFADEVAVPYNGRVGQPIALSRLPD